MSANGWENDLMKMQSLAERGQWRDLRDYGNMFVKRMERSGNPKVIAGVNFNAPRQMKEEKIDYLKANGWVWNEGAIMYLRDEDYDSYCDWLDGRCPPRS